MPHLFVRGLLGASVTESSQSMNSKSALIWGIMVEKTYFFFPNDDFSF